MTARDRAAALGELLRARRAAVDPATLPIPGHGRRRVPGIRRDELAALAGVSTSYYTRIEQGAVAASPMVLDAIADALGLDGEDRAQLRRLAQPPDVPNAERASATALMEGVLHTIDAVPAGLLGRDLTVLGWNRPAHRVFAEHVPFSSPWDHTEPPNWARMMFLDTELRRLFATWEVQAIDLVGRLRAAESWYPEDPSIRAVLDGLRSDSREFDQMWREYPVREGPLGRVELRHPSLGELVLHDSALRSPDSIDPVLFVFLPEPGSRTEAVLRAERRRLQPNHP